MKSAIFNRLKVIYAAGAWGTMALFVRYIDLPTSMIACGRGLIGALFLYLFGAIATRNFRLDWEGIRKNLPVLLISGIALGANWIFLFEAYRRTSVAISTLCYYLAPVLVMIVSTFLYKEKMTGKKAICIGISLIGLVFISGILNQNLGNGYGIDGMIMALVAAILYATVTITGKMMRPYGSDSRTLPSSQETLIKLFVAAIIVIPYSLLTTDLTTLSPSPMMLVMLVILGITHTGATFFAYFSALHHLDNQEVAIITYLDPVVAVIVSLAIGEPMDVFSLIGAVLLIGALIFYEVQLPRRKKA